MEITLNGEYDDLVPRRAISWNNRGRHLERERERHETHIPCDSHAGVLFSAGITYAGHVSRRLLMSRTCNDERMRMHESRGARTKISCTHTRAYEFFLHVRARGIFPSGITEANLFFLYLSIFTSKFITTRTLNFPAVTSTIFPLKRSISM